MQSNPGSVDVSVGSEFEHNNPPIRPDVQELRLGINRALDRQVELTNLDFEEPPGDPWQPRSAKSEDGRSSDGADDHERRRRQQETPNFDGSLKLEAAAKSAENDRRQQEERAIASQIGPAAGKTFKDDDELDFSNLFGGEGGRDKSENDNNFSLVPDKQFNLKILRGEHGPNNKVSYTQWARDARRAYCWWHSGHARCV